MEITRSSALFFFARFVYRARFLAKQVNSAEGSRRQLASGSNFFATPRAEFRAPSKSTGIASIRQL
jgi:hypothetical protein